MHPILDLEPLKADERAESNCRILFIAINPVLSPLL